MKILYAGDSPIGGPANYLLGVLRFLKADFRHLSPSEILKPGLLGEKYDAVILSDFSKSHTPPASQKLIAKQVSEGTGLLMIGGWGSFSGPFGGWRGSLIEKLLPAACFGRDDRVNFPSGALILQKRKHPVLGRVSFKNPPVICGLNQLLPREEGLVLLAARKILCQSGFQTRPPRVTLDPAEYPLLVVGKDPSRRVAAFATDLAPHWSGGLVDWGKGRMKLSVGRGIRIEMGEFYLKFVSSLVKWLARSEQRQPRNLLF